MPDRPFAILIAGPTASGKSSLALELAEKHGGVVVNADASQVYSGLKVLTARPGKNEVDRAPHYLYGHVNPAHAYSVAEWLQEMRSLIPEIHDAGNVPILTGGTGLYFKALLEGLSDIPEADPAIRTYWRDFAAQTPQKLHGELERRDLEGAKKLRPSDVQRLVRALEVFDSTGVPLSQWQERRSEEPVLAHDNLLKIIVEPPRAVLHERIERRFDEMINRGAIEEVDALLKLGLADNLPSMKAIGVRELRAYLRGELALEAATERAKTATRQYAKRQSTWFRNQTGEGWERRDLQT
ncbi:MAG: tRNA (adenosine(37)-N6)-dimethylallyltransferase MiaA [Pseudomonadota bacterium]